jgi:hypothetical protein
MKQKYLKTLVALLLLGALWGAFILYDRRTSSAEKATSNPPQEKILPLASSHIQSVTFRPRDGEAFTCRREGKDWAIVEPKKLPADQSAISSLLTNLTSAAVEDVVAAQPTNLKDFGLDPPVESLEVSTDAKPEKVALRLGEETPTSGGLYAQVGDNPRVVSLASYLKASLEKNLFDVRDKRAMTLDADQIHRIEVEAKGKRWTVAKNPDGIWDVELPPPVRADRFAVEGLVNQLRNLSMQSIVAEDKKKSAAYGLGSPSLVVKLTSPAGSQSIVLGRKDGDKYDAMNSALDPVFTVNADVLTQFQKDPADLRNKDLFAFSPFDANHLEVETPKGHWVFDKQKDTWKEIAPKAKDLPADKAQSLLTTIHDLRATSFPSNGTPAAVGLTKPAYRFQVQFGDKNQKDVVEAAKVGDHVYARRSDDPLASELPKTALDEIEKALGEL